MASRIAHNQFGQSITIFANMITILGGCTAASSASALDDTARNGCINGQDGVDVSTYPHIVRSNRYVADHVVQGRRGRHARFRPACEINGTERFES